MTRERSAAFRAAGCRGLELAEYCRTTYLTCNAVLGGGRWNRPARQCCCHMIERLVYFVRLCRFWSRRWFSSSRPTFIGHRILYTLYCYGKQWYATDGRWCKAAMRASPTLWRGFATHRCFSYDAPILLTYGTQRMGSSRCRAASRRGTARTWPDHSCWPACATTLAPPAFPRSIDKRLRH